MIYTCVGISNLGVFEAAQIGPGRFAIGTDSDQSYLGPKVVLASAVKRVDRVVADGILQYANGTFRGGNTVAGLREGATGIVFNLEFLAYNETVTGWEARAEKEEERYLAKRGC